MEGSKRSKMPLIIGVVLLALFAAAYVFVLSAYKSEGNNRAAELAADTQKAGENRIDVTGRIVTADPLKGDILVRLEFTPHGNLAAGETGALARDLEFYASSASGKNVHEFKKGKLMNPVEAVVEIYEGEPMDYPFDTHSAELSFAFQSAGGGNEAVPVAVELRGSVAGLRIDTEYAKEHTPERAVIDISLERASTARFFSIFIMIAMWALFAA